MFLIKLGRDALAAQAIPKQALAGVAAAAGAIVVNILLVAGAVFSVASPRYIAGLEQFKGNAMIAATLISLPLIKNPPIAPIAPIAPEPVALDAAPPIRLEEAPAALSPTDQTAPAIPRTDAAPPVSAGSQASAAAPASPAVDEFATPSIFLMRQLRMAAGEQLVELRVSLLLSDSGAVESLEIVSSKGDIRVIAAWMSLLRNARFVPAARQVEGAPAAGVASKQVFEFSTY